MHNFDKLNLIHFTLIYVTYSNSIKIINRSYYFIAIRRRCQMNKIALSLYIAVACLKITFKNE